jgi:uncharacterized protein (TIGR02145 family)
MKTLYYFILSILFLSSCDKFDWHNPYDPECPKELFTPSSPGAAMEGNNVKLTWSQQNDDISGFALFRSAEGESITNLTQTQKSTTQYIDASITPGKKYTYYVVAVAGTNKSDTVKAEIIPVIPVTISTGAVTEIAATSAKVSGNITNAGGGIVTSRGICWSTTPNPTVNSSKTTDGTGAGEFTSTLSNLLAGTTYYARAYGENSRGVSYGVEVSFKTLGAPVVTTIAVSQVTSAGALAGGNIITDGGFPITSRGVCWSTTPNPTINNSKTNDGVGVGGYQSVIAGLKSSTTYYIRAYATNAFTTSYGEQFTFNTTVAPLFVFGSGVTDIEGNNYRTVVIGDQEWMEENLKVTKFNDGSSIPYINPLSEWSTASTPALCDWNHDIANGQTFGKLYNYYAIVDTRKLCPVGWRMPTSNDFITLESYIGAPEAGKLMKSAIGWNFWPDPLQGNGNNLSGFNGLAGGRRGGDDFQDYRSIAYWWTTSEFSTSTAISFSLSRENYILARVLLNKVNGLSVRCIKN